MDRAINGVYDILLKIMSTPDIHNSIEIFAEWIKLGVGCDYVEIYMLSTQQGGFEKVFPFSRSEIIKTIPDGSIVSFRSDAALNFSIALGFVCPNCHIEGQKKLILEKVVGSVIEELYRRLYIGRFLGNIKESINFRDQDNYFRGISKLLSNALSMEMVAIREINNIKNLDCRVFYCYSDNFIEGVHFEFNSMPDPFREVLIETESLIDKFSENRLPIRFETVGVGEAIDGRFDFLKSSSELSSVKAFVVFPVVIEQDFFGIISCSTTSKFIFTALEKTAIETAMQLISVSISNFIKYHDGRRMAEYLNDQLFSATEIEIAQSARHELQNIQLEQQFHVNELSHLLKTSRDLRQISDVGIKLQESIGKFNSSILKLRYSAVHASPVLQYTSVKTVWEEALNLIKERLRVEGIDAKYSGPALEGWYYPDWLREAFLNMLFNSVDAFRNRPRRNRVIFLVAKPKHEASLVYTIDYSDNAGGINFSKIHIPEPIRESNPNLSMNELIFQPKVTSKTNSKSSGWGLYLVRQALRIHQSSITLKDTTSQGVTFRIQLKKDQRKE